MHKHFVKDCSSQYMLGSLHERRETGVGPELEVTSMCIRWREVDARDASRISGSMICFGDHPSWWWSCTDIWYIEMRDQKLVRLDYLQIQISI